MPCPSTTTVFCCCSTTERAVWSRNPAGISRSYSAVREYAINDAAMTVTAGNVYYSPNPTIFNSFCGSVYDVNGTYLVDFPDVVGGATRFCKVWARPKTPCSVFCIRLALVVMVGTPIRYHPIYLSSLRPAPSFNISVTQSTLTLAAPQSGQVAVNVAPQNGFSGSVAFTATGFPAGVTYSFSPASSATGSTLAVTVAVGAAPGSYPVTISGTAGSLVSSVTMNLIVTSSFRLTASSGTPQITLVDTAFPARAASDSHRRQQQSGEWGHCDLHRAGWRGGRDFWGVGLGCSSN